MKHNPDCYFLTSGNPADCLCASRRELGLALRALVLCLIAGSIELYAFIVAGSVALLSDVVHIGSDALSFLISIAVIGVAFLFPKHTKKATKTGMRFSFLLLLVGDGLIFYEAINRILVPHEVSSLPTLLAAIAGFILNAIVLFISRQTPKHEQNIRHAFIDTHALSDMAVSIAVILSAIIIRFTEFEQADWIVALGVGYYLLLDPICDRWHDIRHGNIHTGGHGQHHH